MYLNKCIWLFPTSEHNVHTAKYKLQKQVNYSNSASSHCTPSAITGQRTQVSAFIVCSRETHSTDTQDKTRLLQNSPSRQQKCFFDLGCHIMYIHMTFFFLTEDTEHKLQSLWFVVLRVGSVAPWESSPQTLDFGMAKKFLHCEPLDIVNTGHRGPNEILVMHKLPENCRYKWVGCLNKTIGIRKKY